MLDYTDNELQAVQQILDRRYKSNVEIHLADCEVQLDPENDERVERPALYWSALGCNFVVVKLTGSEFQGFFFYQPDKQFSSGRQASVDAAGCVTSLLQSQADQVGRSQGYESGTTAADYGSAINLSN